MMFFDERKKMDNFVIRIWHEGNPGNILPMYLSALKMKEILGFGKISHVDISMFGINLPDVDLSLLKGGFHDEYHSNGKRYGYVPFHGLRKHIRNSDADFLSLEGLCQNINNFPNRLHFDYDKHFPFSEKNTEGGGEGDLVINIRGGEILAGISPLYPMLPIEFYKFLEQKTGKNVIFCGQLDDSIYMAELKKAFPKATWRPSQGAALDFDFIRRSKHIVPCLSTFSWFAAWMSHATRIYFPVAGVLNPAQHFYGNMLPINDDRYEFYLFPIFDALSIENYREYLDPIKGMWFYISHKDLEKATENRSSKIDNYLLSMNIDDVIDVYSEYKSEYDNWGVKGVINMYLREGFFKNIRTIKMDRSFYTRKYPLAALDISNGNFENEFEHYVMKGQFQNYLRYSK
ncbi:hypothetical protein LHT11_14995 [Acetobacter indonesiensis]|uniref:hypothetical protein n=1 Tax=Acetobacter indonesiensis TaxID=104101 RepID=UPI001F31078C|nr:hypothetical protein [Acetobacter indonesiensis]MCG0996485.1 hypothetical protein [Acetobacter indonesiensis]